MSAVSFAVMTLLQSRRHDDTTTTRVGNNAGDDDCHRIATEVVIAFE